MNCITHCQQEKRCELPDSSPSTFSRNGKKTVKVWHQSQLDPAVPQFCNLLRSVSGRLPLVYFLITVTRFVWMKGMAWRDSLCFMENLILPSIVSVCISAGEMVAYSSKGLRKEFEVAGCYFGFLLALLVIGETCKLEIISHNSDRRFIPTLSL